jgi:hypothetical protein
MATFIFAYVYSYMINSNSVATVSYGINGWKMPEIMIVHTPFFIVSDIFSLLWSTVNMEICHVSYANDESYLKQRVRSSCSSLP